MGLTDPQLKFILRGTHGLVAKVLSNTEPGRATQMVLAIARNLGMDVKSPTAGTQQQHQQPQPPQQHQQTQQSSKLGAKPKQQARQEGSAKNRGKSAPAGDGSNNQKPADKGKGNGGKGKTNSVCLCDDEWNVPVAAGELDLRCDGVYMTQSPAIAQRWSAAAHNARVAIGVVIPFPMQLGYREPTLVQFHVQNSEHQRTPAKGYLHHVTVGQVTCVADAQLVELPSLKIRSMLVMLDVCKDRVGDRVWEALVGQFENMKTTIPTLLPAQARSGLIEVVKTVEWSDKTTTIMVRMTEQAVHASMKMLGGEGVTVRTPRELLSQFKILWPDRGELNTLEVCQSWAEKFEDHAGAFMKGGRFALRVPQKLVIQAKQACGQQSEDRYIYILRGLPLDADGSDVDSMLLAVGWAATATHTSRRVSRGTASFQVMASHPPPKLGFHVKWGYLRCHVQVGLPRSMMRKEEEAKKKEEQPPRTWAQALRPAVYTESEPKAFVWQPPDARKTKREQAEAEQTWADNLEAELCGKGSRSGEGWQQVRTKRRKNEPEQYDLSAMGDENEANERSSRRSWADQDMEDEDHQGWQGYEYREDDDACDDDEEYDMQDEDGRHQRWRTEEQQGDEEEGEGDRGAGRRTEGTGVDYAARNRIQIMNNQMEDLTGKVGEMMEMLRALTMQTSS
eukprot:3706021-Amphidinium_carterae.1